MGPESTHAGGTCGASRAPPTRKVALRPDPQGPHPPAKNLRSSSGSARCASRCAPVVPVYSVSRSGLGEKGWR